MKSERILWTVFTLMAAAGCVRGEPYFVGDHKQLFIDDRFVTKGVDVALRMNSPVKQGMVLSGTNSWEDGLISPFGTVLAENGKYRMWYSAQEAWTAKTGPGPSRLCYAESEDGVHWNKPNLGLYEWRGSKQNNILLEISPESTNVFVDPKASASQRYKMIARLHERSPRLPMGNAPAGTGLYMLTSSDGLRWTLHPGRMLPFDPDTLNMALYDDSVGKYLAYVRIWNPQRRVGVDAIDDIMKPWPYVKGVPPAVPGMIEAPTREIPEAFGPDAGDPDNLDFYTSAVVKYPWADDAFFMFPSAYRHFPEPPVGKYSNDGTLDIDMAVSRDGLRFDRISRLPYIGLGLDGSRDSRILSMLIGMIRQGDHIYQYYGGTDFTHGVDLAEAKNLGAVFLVKQRPDGFVSLDAGPAGGSFVTPPVVFHGRQLVLNMDASATGEVRVELQDADGKPLGFYDYDSDRGVPLGGFTFAESDPLYFNSLARVVTWRKGDPDVSRLAGRPVRLAFRLRNVKLYSYQFTN